MVIDGAHNPAAAATVVRTWREEFGGEKATVIFGAVESKDVRGVVDLLGAIAGRWVFTGVNSVRGLEPEGLVGMAGGGGAVAVADAVSALREVEGDARILVCGSLFLAGEVLGLLEGGEFETSAQ